MKSYSSCRRLIVFVLVVSICMLFVACSEIGDSSINSAEKVLGNYSNLLKPITNWLCESEYNDVILKRDSTKMFADFSYYQIPEEIKPMVEELFHEGICIDIYKDGGGNVIIYEIWQDYPQCYSGSYFAIDKTKSTDIEYLTDSSPLSETGWYYYVQDIIKWEVEHTNT